ncbi:hypothetical protein [Nonomuraea soli]|uniref:Hydrogenase maturation factor n=1 Tax=Nonomuraea soli TaxID=1032476 RepID=A0A7W0CUR1_9ACTN|nr:hypothetical protein [Nonomuraea soli]MBA2897666.1 hydrogenase maturation factor [Nonomuraea soli]
MNGHPTTGEHTPATPTFGESAPATPTLPARNEALSVEALIEQARETQRRSIDGLARKLRLGQQPSAEQLYDILRAQTLGTWWVLVERHLRYAGGDQGQTLARFLSLVSFYLNEDDTTRDITLAVGVLGPEDEHEFTLIHLNRAMDLIRRDAARTFLEQLMSLASASSEPEQSASGSAGQEGTA